MRFVRELSCIAFCLLTTPVPAQTKTEARAAYDAMARTFTEALKRGDVDAALQIYTEDVRFVDPDGSVTNGKAELEKSLRGMMSGAQVNEYTIHTSHFQTDGQVAYGMGTEHLLLADKKTHKATTQDVQFLVVARRGPDKGWRLQYGMETPMPPKAKP